MQGTANMQVETAGRWGRILPAMQRLVDSCDYPGLGLLVYRHGQVIYEEVAGWMDVEAARALQPDSLLRMYNYIVLQEVKESLYYYNEEQITADILNYMFAVNIDPGSTEVCA